VAQHERYKYVHFAALPPLFSTWDAIPTIDLAGDPAMRCWCAALSWPLKHADWTLTHYRARPQARSNAIDSPNAAPGQMSFVRLA
jgi:hypothetical protein